MGLEPASSIPAQGLSRAVDEGTALVLDPGGTRELQISATVLTTGAPVTYLGRDGEVHQAG